MTTQDIEQAIRDIIRDLYCAEYNGRLNVKKWSQGYTLTLGLNCADKPLYIMGEGTPEDFLKLIREELRAKRLHCTDYFIGQKIYDNEDGCK